MPAPTPFRIAIPDATIAAIHQRIRDFPWDAIPALEEQGDPWSAGASIPFMRELCDHWLHRYDWRAQEAAINHFPQFIANIAGQDIHFLHQRGSGAHDIALVLTHGWPGSIVEFLHVIDRFAHPERFGGAAEHGIDVVVPALPGFGFSGRHASPIGPRGVAALWDRLLREALGYQRYIAQGGDWGSMVSAMAGLHHASPHGGCIAIHLNMLGTRADPGPANDEERSFEQRCQPFLRDGWAYAETHRTTPQTLAYAMADNPVAQADYDAVQAAPASHRVVFENAFIRVVHVHPAPCWLVRAHGTPTVGPGAFLGLRHRGQDSAPSLPHPGR